MVSYGESLACVWPKRKVLYFNDDIDGIYILELWELGDILRW